MKVIIVAPAFPLRGGIANFSEALANSFIEGELETEIVSYSLQYPSIFFPGKTQYTDGEPPKITITPLINSVNPLTWQKASSYIKKSSPDVAILMYWMPFMAPALGTIARNLKRTSPHTHVMVIAHNIIPHEKFPFNRQLIKYFTKKVDSFITLSGSVKKDLEKIAPGKPVKHLFHPVYSIFGAKQEKKVGRAILDLDLNGRYLLFFGIVRKYKGLEILLKALSHPELNRLDVKLVIAGEFYDTYAEYAALIDKLGLQNRVIINNSFIPQENVRNYFAAADLVVQPYLTATQSGVTQIAYHFEKPMLVTNVGGLSEIVPHNIAGYVTEVDPEAIALAIIDFYTENRETDYTANVVKEKKRFTWEYFRTELLALAMQTN